MEATAKTGLRAYIYRNGADCSNGGISGRCDAVTIIDDEIDAPFAPSDEAPAVRFERRKFGNRAANCFVPVDQPEGRVGPMFGGCYVGSSDSRFARLVGVYGAVPLHDRFETPAEYEVLSR